MCLYILSLWSIWNDRGHSIMWWVCHWEPNWPRPSFFLKLFLHWSPVSHWAPTDRGSWHCTGDRDRDHPQEKAKSKMAVWGGLTDICEKKRREKERYAHLNIEFWRIARRDKKAPLSDQCKEIDGNNRMGKTRELFKKIRHTKGTFHAKMDSIKDRNGMDLTEPVDIKKRWQEYTQKLYKKDLYDPVNHDVWSLT